MSGASTDQEYLKELIVRAKNGEKEAFEEVYALYYTPLFRYILIRVKNKTEAEDMTQTVFLKIWNAIATWNTNHTSPLSFFFTVARNTLIDFFRKNTHREIVSDEIVTNATNQYHTSHDMGKERDDQELLHEAILCLSEEQQEIITLFYMNDLSYKEIAIITRKREDAIRQMHSRALKRLRKLIII